ATAMSVRTGGVPAPPPANRKLPKVSGTAEMGRQLTASTGSWSNEPTSYAYEWLRCNSSGAACSPIAGAASSTYLVVERDVGSRLRVRVVASNAGGPSAPAVS